MAEVKWIKLATDIFDNRKIRLIEKMPEGDGIIVIWLKLLCLAGTVNDRGYIYLTQDVPYTEEMLATQFDRPLAMIRLALTTFERFGMIEIVDNFLLLPSWEKYQNTDGLDKIREQTRSRVAKHRELQKALPSECNVTVTLPVTQCNATEEEIDIDRDIKKEDIDKSISKKESVGKKVKAFSPPTLDDVKAYCKLRNNDVDPKRFFDYFNEGDWMDSEGKPVKNWKQKVITWEKNTKPVSSGKVVDEYANVL